MIEGFISSLSSVVAGNIMSAQKDNSRKLKGESGILPQRKESWLLYKSHNYLIAITRSETKFSNIHNRVSFVKSIL